MQQPRAPYGARPSEARPPANHYPLARERIPERTPALGAARTRPTGPVSGLVIKLLGDVQKRAEQRRDLLNLVADLDRQGASRHAAQIVMEMMKR